MALAKIFHTFGSLSARECLHMVVDVDRWTCDPDYKASQTGEPGWSVDDGFIETRGTEDTSRIAGDIASVVTKMRPFVSGTCFVYYGFDDEDHTSANGGLYKVEYKPSFGDFLFRKQEMSVHDPYNENNIDNVIAARGAKTLLYSGFNVGACLQDSVLGSLERGYNVIILSDCVGDAMETVGSSDIKDSALSFMQESGAIVTTSNDFMTWQVAKRLSECPVGAYKYLDASLSL